MEAKTILQLFEEMKEPEKSLAIANTSEHMLQNKRLKIHHALSGAFIWEQSNEGFNYWQRVTNFYASN